MIIAAINNDESVAIIKNDKIIADTMTDALRFPTVSSLLDYWWSSDSNRFYYTYGFHNEYLVGVNIEEGATNTSFNAGIISSSIDASVYNKKDDYIVFSTYVQFSGGVSDWAKYENEKHLVELKLLNLKTNEFFVLDKNNEFPYSVKQVSDTVISYTSPYREDEVILDISYYIEEGRRESIDNVIHFVLDNDSTIKPEQFFVKSTDKFNGAYYHVVDINGRYNIYKEIDNSITLIIEDAARVMNVLKDDKLYLYFVNDGACELRIYENDTYTVINHI